MHECQDIFRCMVADGIAERTQNLRDSSLAEATPPRWFNGGQAVQILE